MITIQIGIIIFLIFVLAIIYQDELKKRRLARKSGRLNRFWNTIGEKRQNRRINAEIKVLYEVASGEMGQKRNSISRNISLGGINLAISEKLFPQTILELQLNIPQSPRPIFVQGEIVWVKEITEHSTQEKEQRLFATGIKFTQINPKDEAILLNFVNSFQEA